MILLVIGHFHFTLAAGNVVGLFAGMYYWYPKVTGRLLDEKLGKWHFWLFTIGLQLTFVRALPGLPGNAEAHLYLCARPRLESDETSLPQRGFSYRLPHFHLGLERMAFGRVGKPAGDDPWGWRGRSNGLPLRPA